MRRLIYSGFQKQLLLEVIISITLEAKILAVAATSNKEGESLHHNNNQRSILIGFNMSTLSQFIGDLATNPKLQQDYLSNPAATMQSYGLQNHEVEAVLASDKAKVEQLTGTSVNIVTYMFPVK